MKEKNFPDDYISKTLEELTLEVSKIINELEKKGDIKESLAEYHKLITLNNLIEKKFQKKSKIIKKEIKDKIENIYKKNVKKFK
tara:strand:- start:408 stop:659 length:252 start_codon:yes stop_codon:yes gene_type:complete